MNYGINFIELVRELEVMPEHQRLQKIKHFGVSLHIFQHNYYELIQHLNFHNTPKLSLKLMGQDNRHLLHAYQIEITRFLHNYIASSLSLIDHTRNHYRELYGKNELFPDYQIEIDKRFVNFPLSVFVKDLRQFFQHFQMPGLSSKLKYTRGASDFIMSINLTLDDLNKFSGWKAKSKEYLASFEKEIDLKKLIEEYHKHVSDFYNWFIKRQNEIHAEDIQKVEAHKKKIRDNEMGRFFTELIKQPKSIDEIEKELSKLYREDDLAEIKDSKSSDDRFEKITELLKGERDFNKETRDVIERIYKK
jgi:hypothetical protein